MIHIKEPSTPWEVAHISLVTALAPGGEKIYNACLVIVYRFSKTQIFLPFNKYYTALDTVLLIWNRAISHIGLFKNIIGDRDPKFNSSLWKNLHKPFSTKPSFSKAHHLKTDSLMEGMIQNVEEMIKRFFCLWNVFKGFNGFAHHWWTLIPELESVNKTQIHASTGQSHAMLVKICNPKHSFNTLNKYLVNIHLNSSSFKSLLGKVKHHVNH
ncbi:hypothetical protein O181_007242 [Austropuccinia psidii MF-1]|uniref:Integrase catalytic domain-containing protein n=1 Tax=Austropuccinia psidii MF-1 TaxID=1389203 RepID=A0A9Q3BLJ2_9BASI|nr:hypothetical protein [Austropuccinia psidii MF-1]